MIRLLQILLVVALFVELVVVAFTVTSVEPEMVPPLPDMAGYNPYTAERLRELHARCEPREAADWIGLSDAYIAHGFYPEAEACARVACKLSPADGDLLQRWAFCLSSMGRMSDAIEKYQAARKLPGTDSGELAYLIGRDYLRLENVSEAVKALRQAEPLPAAVYELAKLDLRDGNLQSAVERVDGLQQLYPNAYAPHLLRAQAEAGLGNAEAAADYRLLSQLNRGKLPTPVDAFRERYLGQLRKYALAEFIEGQSAKVEAGRARDVRAAIEKLPGKAYEPQLEDLLANVDIALGNPPAQQARLLEIIRRDGASTYRCWRLATALAADGKIQSAIDWLKTGLRLDLRDSVRESLEQLILYYEQLGDLPRARYQVSQLFYWEGTQALREADVQLALQKLSNTVKIDPRNAEAWYWLGVVYGLLRDEAAQRKALQSCLDIKPNHGQAVDALQKISTNVAQDR